MLLTSIGTIGSSQVILASSGITGIEALRGLGTLLQDSVDRYSTNTLPSALVPHKADIKSIHNTGILPEAMECLLGVAEGKTELSRDEVVEISTMISGVLTFFGEAVSTSDSDQVMVSSEVLMQSSEVEEREERAQREGDLSGHPLAQVLPGAYVRISQLSAGGKVLDFYSNKEMPLLVPEDEILDVTKEDARIPKELAMVWLKAAKRAIETQIVQIFEYAISQPDGVRHFEARMVAAGPDEVVVISNDITGHKQAEEALKASEAFLQGLIQAVPDLIFRVDRDGTFLDFHAPKEEDLFVNPNEIVGRKFNEMPFPPKILDLFREKIEAAFMAQKTQTFTYSLPMLDGEQYFEARLGVSGTNEITAIIRNVTKLKRALEMALRAERLKTIEYISHSWMNVLAIAAGVHEELKRLFVQRQHLQDICNACEALGISRIGPVMSPAQAHLDKMISAYEALEESFAMIDGISRNVLSYSQSGSGEKEFVFIKARIAGLASELQESAARQKVNLVFDLCDISDFEGVLISDIAFQNIIRNPVINALECFSESAHSEDRNVEVRITKGNGSLIIKVIDNGPGMSKELVANAFSEWKYSYRPGGTGLGLLTVKEAVNSVGGTVFIRSAIDEGTELTVTLPLEMAVRDILHREEDKYRPQITPEEAATLRVMIVDDQPNVLEISGKNLESIGFKKENIFLSQDPLVAIEEYDTMQEKPHIVLVDQTMPQMQGHLLIERLSSLESAGGSRFVFYSGNLTFAPNSPIAGTIQRLDQRDIPIGYIQKSGDPERFRYEVSKIGREVIDSISTEEVRDRIEKAKKLSYHQTPVPFFQGRVIHKVNNVLFVGTAAQMLKEDAQDQESIPPDSLLMKTYRELAGTMRSLESFTHLANQLHTIDDIRETWLPQMLYEDPDVIDIWNKCPANERYKFAVIAFLYLNGVQDYLGEMDRILSKKRLNLRDLKKIEEISRAITRVNDETSASDEEPEGSERFRDYYHFLARMPGLQV